MSNTDKKKRGAVVVTGTSTGIGRATAERLAGMGFRVFAGVRKQADWDALRESLPGVTPLMIDVTDRESIRAAAAAVSSTVHEAGLRGLVNNAGVTVPGPLEFLPLDDLRRQLEVNLIGPVAVTQAFLPLVRLAKGRIVNVGSIGGRMSSPFLGAYHASKFALEAVTDSLRQELAPWGIHVSLIEPGGVNTPLWERGRAAADGLLEGAPAETEAMYGQAIQRMREASVVFEKRGAAPDKVARVVAEALIARRPQTRYLVGMDARAQAMLKTVATDRMLDRLVAWQLKLPKKA